MDCCIVVLLSLNLKFLMLISIQRIGVGVGWLVVIVTVIVIKSSSAAARRRPTSTTNDDGRRRRQLVADYFFQLVGVLPLAAGIIYHGHGVSLCRCFVDERAYRI